MPTLCRIEMLGRLRATVSGREVARFRSQKTGGLLGYLACAADRPHTRERLIDAFWPESSPTAARACLSTALASLRRQLEPPDIPASAILIASREAIQLNPATTSTDRAEFLSLLQAARRGSGPDEESTLRGAIGLYGGDFLPALYDDWALAERERLHAAYVGALRRLSECCESAGRFAEAMESARIAIAAEPLDEDVAAALIRLCVASGQPALAAQEYNRIASALRTDLDAEPSRELRALAVSLGASARIETAPVRKSLARVQGLRSGSARAPMQRAETAHRDRDAALRDHTLRIRSYLPPRLDRFFGREQELTWIAERIASGRRLITITGTGGSGKTRLAAELASRLGSGADTEVGFVLLADLTDPVMVARRIASSLGLPLTGRDPAEVICAAMGERPLLLILDNFEQLLCAAQDEACDPSTAWVLDLLARLPALVVLVTSRRALGVPGEQMLPLDPLPTPTLAAATVSIAGPTIRMLTDPASAADAAALIACPSVALFIDRAQASRPDFQLSARNADHVAQICTALEGLPLAIELAAARVGHDTVAQIRQALATGLELAPDRRRGVAERHRSLRACLDWSFQLLEPDLRRVFLGLATFAGGWTAESARAVCGGCDEHQLAELQARSLVAADPDADGARRYHMLETIREYAAARSPISDRDVSAARHSIWFTEQAERACRRWYTGEEDAWIAVLTVEVPNLRSAIGWSLDSDPHRALCLCGALTRFWYVRGLWREGSAFLSRALDAAGAEPTAARALALIGHAMLATLSCTFAPSHLSGLLEARDIYRNSGDRWGEAHALRHLMIIDNKGRDAAMSYGRLAADLFAAIGDRAGAAMTLHCMGYLTRAPDVLNAVVGRRPSPPDAVEMQRCTDALKLFRELGFRWGICRELRTRSDYAFAIGDHAAARAGLEEALATARDREDWPEIAACLDALAAGAHAVGAFAEADRLLREALPIYYAIGQIFGCVACFDLLAALAAARGDAGRSARLYGAADALAEKHAMNIVRDLRPAADRAALAQPAPSVYESNYAHGQAMPLAQAVAEACSP